jgi:type I restriction enzyme S subunit
MERDSSLISVHNHIGSATETVGSQLPVGWRMISLEEVVSPTKLVDPSKNPDWIFKYVDVSSVSRQRLEIIGSTEYSSASAPSRARKEIRYGDIIFATVRPSLMRIARIPSEFDKQVCSTAFCVIRPNPMIVDRDFLFYAVANDDFVSRVSSKERGVSYPAVTDKDVLRESIVLPPIRVQKQIAHILSTIRESIHSTREVIKLILDLKKSMMEYFFSEKQWSIKQLGTVAHLTMGQSPSSTFYNSTGEGLPFLQGKADFNEKYPRPTKYCSQELKVCEKGDVLMSVRAPVGDVNIADQKFIIGRGLASLRMIYGNNDFLFYLLTYLKPKIEALGSGTTFDSVNKGNLSDLEIPIPSISEQSKISTALSCIDNKLDSEQVHLSALSSLYHTMIHELLFGRIPVTTLGKF